MTWVPIVTETFTTIIGGYELKSQELNIINATKYFKNTFKHIRITIILH